MLDSLEIKNYRNLKDLQIKSLGKVNLLTGKNNTGKSTLLEAVAIYASKGDLSLILEFLEERGEYSRRPKIENYNILESNIKAFSSLFTNRIVEYEGDNKIFIGKIKSKDKALNTNVVLPKEIQKDNPISFQFIKYHNQLLTTAQKANASISASINESFSISKNLIGFEIIDDNRIIIPLNEEFLHKFVQRELTINHYFQFIRTRNIDKEINGKLWDNIILTDKENNVIEALKIIEPATEKIAFIEGNTKDRSAVIKLSGSQSVLPLLSMGDGINRILTIILALVNAENGYLLIDEFENGLHHSVQEKLWKIIFILAEKLNVQVFATTHSEDCISGFEQVLNKEGNAGKGKLIRLENVKGQIKQVEFDANELKIANENDIEIR